MILAIVVGSCYWQLILAIVVGSCYWQLAIVVAVSDSWCCDSVLLILAVVDMAVGGVVGVVGSCCC